MKKLIYIFSTGLLISFLGTLPIGTLNITAFQLAASKNIDEAGLFAIAVILVELIVVYMTLYGAGRINFNNRFFRYLAPMSILLLICLSIYILISAEPDQLKTTDSNILCLTKSSFQLGLLLSVLNPMHVPFWMGWNSVLISKNKLTKEPGMYSSYITGIGLGSLAGLMLFILSGHYILTNFQEYNKILAYVMAGLYMTFAVYLTIRLYKNNLKLRTTQ